MIKVLLIEDDPVIAQTARAILKKNYYELTCVETGAEGVAAFRKDSNQLVILDMRLPDMSGLSVFAHLIDIAELPCVITCSAYAYTMEIEEIQSFPNTRNVPKPYHVADLLHAVEDLAKNNCDKR
jgi:DNA-binding response OmpR family regulator